jgi:hypothetical protein
MIAWTGTVVATLIKTATSGTLVALGAFIYIYVLVKGWTKGW